MSAIGTPSIAVDPVVGLQPGTVGRASRQHLAHHRQRHRLADGGEQHREQHRREQEIGDRVRPRRRWRASTDFLSWKVRPGDPASRASRARRLPAAPARAASRSRRAAARRASRSCRAGPSSLRSPGRSRSRTPRHARPASAPRSNGQTRARTPARPARPRRRGPLQKVRAEMLNNWRVLQAARGGGELGRRRGAPPASSAITSSSVVGRRRTHQRPAREPPSRRCRESRSAVAGMPQPRSRSPHYSIVGAPPPARKASRARRSAGNRSRSGSAKLQPRHAARSSRGDGGRQPSGPGQRVRDRDAHVGRAKLRQHAAVVVADHAVDDRLRMHQHADLRRRAGRTAGRPRSPPAPCSSWWRS